MTGEFLLKISTDMMVASGSITPGDREITAEIIKTQLAREGITIGLREDNINKLLEMKDYNIWITVAEGKPAGESKAGYIEYFFDTKVNDEKGAIIKEDGSVYYGRKKAEVHEGDKLCTYHSPFSGAFGYTVYSTVIAPKPIADVKLEAGEGVKKVENDYFAEVAGEVILNSNRIIVNNVLTIDGNAKYGVDTQTEFVGGIHITGDVLTGVSIKAKGRIEVDGTVEAANLYSDEDIIIRGGIKGDLQAKIESKGSVICPFIENGNVFAEDTIQADYVMRSNLTANNAIRIHGANGKFVGGHAIVRNEFHADEVGNDAGVTTLIEVTHPDLRLLERSYIIGHKSIHTNVTFKIGGVSRFTDLYSGVEYHMVDSTFVNCAPGKYVPRREYVEEASGDKKVVMIVDDEPIILKTFFGFLNEKYTVLLASSAKDALGMLKQREPDLILLDVKMPVMDGPEFLDTIRHNTLVNYAHIPVMFVTAANDKETIKKCIKLFPQGYLVKPIGREELLANVDKFFESK